MQSYLRPRSPRFGYDGWALLMPGASRPLDWTVSTTREEVRDLKATRADLFERGAEIVKVKIRVEACQLQPDAPTTELNSRAEAA